MKKIIILLLVVASAALVNAQSNRNERERAAQKTVIDFFEALSNRDSVALKSHCTQDVVLIEYGSRWTLDTLIRRGIANSPPADFKRTNEIEFIKTTVSKNTASMVYNLYSSMTMNGDKRLVHWLETVFLLREKKYGWRIALLHSTRISSQ